MANNNDISVTIDVTGNGKEQLSGINTALSELKNSVDNMAAPLSKVANNVNVLNNNLTKYNSEMAKVVAQNKEMAKAGGDTTNKVADMVSMFSTWSSIIETVGKGLTGMRAGLAGVLAVVTTFAPEIFNFVSALFKGKEAIDEAKMSIGSMNKALEDTDYSNAVKQINELKINVGLAKKDFIDKEKVVKQYNETVGKTMGQVRDLKAVEDNLIKNGDAYIRMMLLKASAQMALQDAAKKAYEAEQVALKPDDEVLTFWDKVVDFANRNKSSMGAGSLGPNGPDITQVWKKADEYKKATVGERRTKMQKDANDQKEAFFKIAKKFQEEAAEIAKTMKFDLFEGTMNTDKPKITPKPPKYTYKKLEKLEGSSVSFAEILEHRQQEYEQEQALLDKQYAEKLIGQEEYQQKSDELQKRFQKNIGRQIKDFNATELAALQQHMKDMFIIQRHDDIMANDEKAVKKAILPGDKLAAEKKLIEDKYAYEIALVAGKNDEIKKLEEQRLVEITALTQRHEQERKAFALQTTQAVSDTAFSMLKDSIRSRTDAKLKELNDQKQLELSNTSLTGSQKQAIEAKYKKKEAEEKVKAFKAEQRASILQAVINGALAITKATSQTGVLAAFAIPAIIVSTALQVATIAKQKPPQYAQGGLHYQSDGRGALLSGYSRTDDTNAYLRSGEAVVVSEAMRNPWARNLVSAINVAHGGRDFSVANPGRGYAIGGVFTDGGNANRYYNQPVTDAKELANTMAYQMINNFPPIYVDVKDVNNQQNILAQTVNRVNL